MAWLIYLLGLVDGWIFFFGLISVLSIIAIIITSIITIVVATTLPNHPESEWSSYDRDCVTNYRAALRVLKTLIKVAIPSLIIAFFTPSSKTIAAMYLVPKIAQNESAQQIPEKALNILNLKLEEWGNDLVKEKHETK